MLGEWVDFHYEINGKTVEFSIPGGGFVSLEHVVEVLGIASADENSDNAENSLSASSPAYEEAIKLNGIEVSEATRKFVADVESVEFSDPELVWVGKTDSETTVGGLKEANGLEVEYSAELTEEQIAEINAQTVEAGDWALISMQPFTSEESLTITMKNGDQWTVKVTDAQISTHVITADGEDYIITVTYGPEAGIPDGAKLKAREIKKETDEYTRYLERALEALHGTRDASDAFQRYQVALARFFDISIMWEGNEIEPLAPVSVTIAYAGKVMDFTQDVSVVHFAQTGIEVLAAEAGIDEEQTSVNFKQSSFSVTGTIVDYTDIGAGDYYIMHYDDYAQKWYALAYNGNYVDVTAYYDASSASISGYAGNNLTWTVTPSGSGYIIKAKNYDRYITLNDSVTGTDSTVVQLHSGSIGERNTVISVDDSYIYHYYWWGRWFESTETYRKKALGWENGFVSSNSSNYEEWGFTYYRDAPAVDVQFAKQSEDSEIVDPDWPNKTYNDTQLQAWLDQAMTDQPLQDVQKIGYVSDYDNRIYKLDFSAKSGVLGIASDLSLAFVTDVSNSMLFPSKLTNYRKSGVTTENIKMTQDNLNKICNQDSDLKTGKNVFFTVADKSGTSTVCALYRENGTWYAMDASYYARWQAGIKKVGDVDNYDYIKNRQILIMKSTHTALHKEDAKDRIDYSNNTSSDKYKNAKAGDEAHSSVKYTIYTGNSQYFTAIQHKQIYDMSDNGTYGIQPDGTVTSYNMGNRLYYLEDSVAKAVNDMKEIAKEYPLGAVYAGIETFAKDVQEWTDGYLKIGGNDTNMANANNTYKGNVSTIYKFLKNIKGVDGTRQDLGLDKLTGKLGTPNAEKNMLF